MWRKEHVRNTEFLISPLENTNELCFIFDKTRTPFFNVHTIIWQSEENGRLKRQVSIQTTTILNLKTCTWKQTTLFCRCFTKENEFDPKLQCQLKSQQSFVLKLMHDLALTASTRGMMVAIRWYYFPEHLRQGCKKWHPWFLHKISNKVILSPCFALASLAVLPHFTLFCLCLST